MILWLLTVLLGGPLILCAQSDAGKIALKRGQKHLNRGEYRLAALELKKGLRTDPADPELNFAYGKALFLTQEKVAAFEPLKKALQTANPTVEHNWFFAQCLHIQLSLDSAETFYRKALDQLSKSHPEREQIVLNLRQVQNARNLIASPVSVKIENLGSSINSPFPEYTPIITADESRLYFTSRRFSNLGRERQDDLPHEDVYYSRRNLDGSWTAPANMGAPVNTDYHDATVCLSSDGRQLWIYRDEGFYEAELKGRKIHQTMFVGPPVETTNHEPSASLSSDGKTLYFARDSGPRGDYDLFVSRLDSKGRWSEPLKLPETINTPQDDNGPFIHPDGRTLYFASKGHNSMGGYDLFRATMQQDGTWSQPVNLGWPLNSADDDLYFVVTASGRFAYFSSTRAGGYGSHDLYRIDLRPDTTKPEIEQPKVLLVKGRLLSADLDLPVGATIYILDLEKNDTLTVTQSDPETGEYLVALPAGSLYALYIERDKYQTETRNFDTRDQKGFEEVRQNINLKPAKLQVGERLLLRNIFFDFNRSTLRPESEAELERLYALLQQNPRLRIRIRGHTDSVGPDDYNLQLSADRARAVVDYLIHRGVSPSRLESEGLGEGEPVGSNDTEAGRQSNRRTEFEVLQL